MLPWLSNRFRLRNVITTDISRPVKEHSSHGNSQRMLAIRVINVGSRLFFKQPNSGLGPFIVEVPRSLTYTYTPGSITHVLFCIFFANWHSPAALTEVFPCFFVSCKANARVYHAKTGHGPYSSYLVNCVVLCIVCVDCVALCIVCV